MLRINQYEFFQFGRFLHPLAQVTAESQIKAHVTTLYAAKSWLEYFLQDQVIPLVVCKTAGYTLLQAIAAVLPDFSSPTFAQDVEKKLEYGHFYDITSGLQVFENVLAAELQTLDTYFISQKGAFATRDVIEKAEIIFPESVRKLIPDAATKDIRQAGKALVFDLPTAAGFHIVRATESVIRVYYAVVVGAKPLKRDWGTYVETLRKKGADPKIVAAVDQMRSLHRNPLIHPEEVLSEEDAIVLFGIAQSAIVAMVSDIDRRQKAIAPALAAARPSITT